MLKNYLRTTWRTITRNKAYSIINISGLTIGLCACMIVGSIVLNDLSYDKQWTRGNNIYRILSLNKMSEGVYDKFPSVFVGLLPVLQNDFPEVKSATAISSSDLRLKVNEADPNGIELNTLQADTSFWKMLDIKVLAGNPRKYISGKNNLIITESLRKKYFPNENPIGKIFNDVPTYSSEPVSYVVTGVIRDLPSNSIFRADAITPYKPWDEALNKNQAGTFTQAYVLFRPGTDIKKFTEKLNVWYAKFVESKNPYQYEFQPLKDCYLHSDFAGGQKVKGDYRNLIVLGSIALLLLIIACVNFVNLSTARAAYRLKETGIRKILGAGRKNLIGQFLTESLLFFLVSTTLALVIYGVAMNSVQSFIGHPLEKTFLNSPVLLSQLLAGIICISLLTGLYPAWLLSGFKPAATLKGKLFSGNTTSQNLVRKGLVVLQFAISIFVLVALIVIQNQVSFMKHKDPGFNKNNLLNISFINWNGKSQTFKNEIRNIPGVESAAITSWFPGSGKGYASRLIDNPNRPGEKINVWYINGDADLAQTLGLKLKEGRFLNPNLRTDAVPPDSAMENMKNRSAILTNFTAKFLHANMNQYLKNVSVVPVGVVGDFNSESLKSSMEPTIITAQDSLNYGSMLVRIKPGTDKKVASGIQQLLRSFFPNNFIEIKWVDDMVNEQYKTESKLQTIFTFFSSLAMLLAALGILGLIIQATAQRIKEIGIRKVLGASIGSIFALFSIDFVKLILISLVIATPFAWWLMHQWLQDYAYRISIGWWVFVIAGITAIAIALITISFQAIKAARANPVESLRTE